MKKTLKTTTLLIAVIGLRLGLMAQTDGFYFPDINGDSVIRFQSDTSTANRYFDMDGDGNDDFLFIFYYGSHGMLPTNVKLQAPFSLTTGWETAVDRHQPENNVPIPDCSLRWDGEAVYYPTENGHGVSYYFDIEEKVNYAIRKKVEIGEETHYYYGWMICQQHWKCAYQEYDSIIVRIEGIAFCTILDYPLHFGQTSLDWNVNEVENKDFATIMPNPTTGLVTVKGNGIQHIEVYDLKGQRVLNRQPENNHFTIDLSGQPAGIYLFNITDKAGHRCIKKIVKQ